MSDNKKVSGSMLALAIDKILDLLGDKADQTDLEAAINSAKEYADERFFVITCELGERNESPVYPLTNLNRYIDEIFNHVYSAPIDYIKVVVLRVNTGDKVHDLRLVSYENNTLYFGAIDGNGVYVACIDYNDTPWFGSDTYLTSSSIEDQVTSGHMAAPTSNAVYNAIESHNAATNAHEDIRNALNTKVNASDLATKQDRIDSFNWSPSTLPSNSTWEAIAYGNGMFVAIANDSNKTAYSTDGEHWTETTNLPSESSWQSITYGKDMFVAVAYGTVAAYSTDGITWTAATLPSSRNWCSVAYGNGMFVAIAGSSNVAAYSTDGINWQTSNVTVGVSWESVAYGNGMFVAIENGTNVAAYSTDGITWTSGTLPQSTRWRSLTYGNGRFVAVAYNTNVAAYSIDGIHWTESTLPTTTYWCSVAYGNGVFVVVTYNKTISAYSTDGENWVEIALPHSAYGFAATYGNGIFAAVGYSTDRAIYAKMPAVLTCSFESDVKGIVDESVSAIPTPDVSGQINAHNEAADAHADIRTAVSNAQSKADSAYNLASGKADPSSIPTKTSQLTNDSGYITSVPVTSVNGKTGEVQLSASDVGAAESSHNQAASTITAGTFAATDVKAMSGTDYTTARIRNIKASTTDLTAGSSSLTSGDIYFVYE